MSRRESRDSDPKRQRSRFDRESSPKRSRRDEKPDSERVLSKKDSDVRGGSTETDKKPRQSLRDAAPLEPDTQNLRKDDEKKHSGHHEITKQASHPSDRPRSRPYHQHDDRRSARKDDRRATSERGSWRSSRDQSNRRADEDNSTWRHDRFQKSDDTQVTVSRKRPAFREKKIQEEHGNNRDRTRTEETKDIHLNNRRQNERNWRSNMYSERAGMGRDRVWNRDDERGVGSRQSYGAYRDRFSSNDRSGFGTRIEKKWDHDLFEEANKSPVKANEEEQIAKVEALLAS